MSCSLGVQPNAGTMQSQPIDRLRLASVSMVGLLLLTAARCQSANVKPTTISGQIEADEIHIGVPAPLRVTTVYVHEGDHVTQGQTLFELDNSELKAKSSGVKLMLNTLTKEVERLHSSIARLEKHSPQAKVLNVSGALGKTHRPKPATPDSVSAPPADSGAGKTQQPNSLLNAQLEGMDEELLIQKKELDDGYARQLKLIEAAIQAKKDGADQTYNAQKSALEEVKKAKLQAAQKHSFFSFLIPRKLRDAQSQGITEVVKAKEEALTQAYTQGKDGINQVLIAEENAAKEAFSAKQQALEEAYKAKHGAAEQLSLSMSAMQKSAVEQQGQIQKQLASFQSSLSGAIGGPQAGMAGAMAASQSGMIGLQLDAARTRLLAVESEIAKVKAGQLEIDAKSKMLKITSPITGSCATSSLHAGEIPYPGQSLMTLINPRTMHLRAYIPENLIGGIKIGQRAHVHLDFKQAPILEATVTRIDEQASFTPDNVSLPQDRVRQVFGVVLKLNDPNGYAKAGLPADATIDMN